MKTIFLAAGKSTRAQPIADKNFLEFCGEPLILKILKIAKKGGAENFIIVTNDENQDKIANLCKENEFLNNSKIAVQKNGKEGMAGGVLAGLEYVDDDDELLILGGNDVVDWSVFSEIFVKGRKCDGAILAKRVTEYFPGGYLEIDKESQILSIVEKPEEGKEPSDLVNIVVHFFRQAKSLKIFLKKVSGEKDEKYEKALGKFFQEKKVLATEYGGQWHAIKFPWHALAMSEYFLKNQKGNIDSSAEIADSATLKNPEKIIIASGVKIMENATIVGPAYLGKNVIIGQNVLVRDSSIGDSSVIGFNSEVARSVLAKNVSTHFAYIGDSVVGENVNFGAFSCTANLKLDESNVCMKIKEKIVDSGCKKCGAIIGENVKIGVGAKIMPGRKIFANVFVGPNEVVKK
jgi:bifunctional UDP-N-acetylglucosamine pyrophosphorylase/glucosamine-1-phosphate N-acetyltransferase